MRSERFALCLGARSTRRLSRLPVVDRRRCPACGAWRRDPGHGAGVLTRSTSATVTLSSRVGAVAAAWHGSTRAPGLSSALHVQLSSALVGRPGAIRGDLEVPAVRVLRDRFDS